MKLSESGAFIMISILLLRRYARDTQRRTRMVLVAIAFVAVHLLHSAFSSDPLFLSSGNFASFSSSSSSSNEEDYFRYASASDSEIVVFYNLFVPPGTDEGAANAINVIEDQMGQVALALRRIEDMLNGNKQEEKGVVYYNLIGNPDAFPPDKFSALCHQLHPRLECIQLQHYPSATESVTLKNLHDFCHSPHVKDANRTRVAYLHSKGSYHDHGKQQPWRRELTNSSLHPTCLHPPDDSCDVCGAQYFTMFSSMFPGNMWTAKCDYVRKLLPPVEGGEFVARREEAIKKFLILKSEGVVQNRLQLHQDVFYGLDRYQWEHWVGSHPSIRPCDVISPHVGFWDMVSGIVEPKHYEWSMGPRRMYTFDKPGDRAPYLGKDADFNLRQYYFLAGNMVKWIATYGEVPPQSSWVWNHFPEGNTWKEFAANHGTNAVNAMVEASNPHPHSGFGLNHSSAPFNEKALSRPKNFLVVFYHIWYPDTEIFNDAATAAIEAQFDVLSMGQYDSSKNSFDKTKKILLYYTIAGGGTNKKELVSQLCQKHSNEIDCQPLGFFNANYVEGETLHELHTFCNAKSSFDVVYITNQLQDAIGKSDNRFDLERIKATTAAVMSKTCQFSKDCNVCGTEFYPLPYSHFTGNMFSATCEYVSLLLPPQTFENEMYGTAGDAFLAHLRTQFTTELFAFNPKILGLHQHSAKHWIGGHPDLKPCDVFSMKEDQKLMSNHFSLSIAPRRGSAPPGHLDTGDREDNFRLRREVALREYYYLAGNIFRWFRLYDKIPDRGSWVWDWFPDGQLWETAARASGANAVNEIAKQLEKDSGGSMEQFWVE
eukprot:CAMPEP_0183718684 /NCGR_PEP_ID=MMETSP0737-20130205/11876_1 /TAXON_ID=385413 /ORGANISM="Thalassiosira miniscula, Strain CCMP1093" /LENGTH=824 /DNA_ID=CAMNT_0025948291 /DNA_START=113 /DNA_END=2587 /DNA_ORIENTATION=+